MRATRPTSPPPPTAPDLNNYRFSNDGRQGGEIDTQKAGVMLKLATLWLPKKRNKAETQ